VSEAKMAVPFAASSPDPEVPAKAQRRKFSAEDKKRILEDVERATGHGGIGAVLRREGIYSSTLYGWRKERDAAVHKAFSQKRGPRPQRNPLAGENEKLRRQNQRLQEELEKAHRHRRSKKSGQVVGLSHRRGSQRGEVIMTALDQLRPLVGMKQACQALSVPRATWYRRSKRRAGLFPAAPFSAKKQRHSTRALSGNEQSTVLACLHEERFQDGSPAQVYAALLDEGRFHCSIRTMYRLLETHGESRERRDQHGDGSWRHSLRCCRERSCCQHRARFSCGR